MAKGVKTGGRRKGSPNKVTKELREAIKEACDKEIAKTTFLLNKLPPKDRLDFLIKLLPYVIPKYESVELDAKNKQKDGVKSLSLIYEQIYGKENG